MSEAETGGGEGVEWLTNEPFNNYPLLGGRYTEGQHTKKIYHIRRLVGQSDIEKKKKKKKRRL